MEESSCFEGGSGDSNRVVTRLRSWSQDSKRRLLEPRIGALNPLGSTASESDQASPVEVRCRLPENQQKDTNNSSITEPAL